METATSQVQPLKGASQVVTIGIIGVMFFIFGFVTWLNGPLITFVKLAFTLSDVEAFLVPMVFYMSYFFLALPSAFILKRTGMKKAWRWGCWSWPWAQRSLGNWRPCVSLKGR